MPITFGQPAWLDTIADRVAAALVKGTGLPRDLVFDYFGDVDDLLLNPPRDRFAQVEAPPEMPADLRLLAGAGAAHTGFDSTWHVNLFARLNTDQEFRDARALRDKGHGLGELVRKACRALQLNPLVAEEPLAQLLPPGAGVTWASPLREPMRLVRAQFNGRKPKSGWGWCRTAWSVKFRTDLTAA